MSDLEIVEANLEAALAEQDARHAVEDGRDLARERCVEAMISAALGRSKGDREAMSAALDAALASGYVIRP